MTHCPEHNQLTDTLNNINKNLAVVATEQKNIKDLLLELKQDTKANYKSIGILEQKIRDNEQVLAYLKKEVLKLMEDNEKGKITKTDLLWTYLIDKGGLSVLIIVTFIIFDKFA